MTWKFDDSTAIIFEKHAVQHIPNYKMVIDQCVDICKSYNNKDIKIIDVGCALGETLKQLHNNGFTNLHGVDNSESMLSRCPVDIATLTCSSDLPTGNYDVIIINWTLHFIKDKVKYLKSVYEQLNENGVLILTEKTSKQQIPLKFYHDYKRKQGVSEIEIVLKAEAVKDIMFINDVEWYQTTLKKLGFSELYIINAFWCFTTFVGFKTT